MNDDNRPEGNAVIAPAFSAWFDPASVLHLYGEVDVDSTTALRTTLESLVRSGRGVSLDLSEVSFMDSSAVHTLLGVAQLIGDRGRMVLLRASPAAQRIIELCGAGSFFEHR